VERGFDNFTAVTLCYAKTPNHRRKLSQAAKPQPRELRVNYNHIATYACVAPGLTVHRNKMALSLHQYWRCRVHVWRHVRSLRLKIFALVVECTDRQQTEAQSRMAKPLNILRSLRALTAVIAVTLGSWMLFAGNVSADPANDSGAERPAAGSNQEGSTEGATDDNDNKTEEKDIRDRDRNLQGYDRPTPYPRIRFSPRQDADEGDEDAVRDARARRSRVYLVDVSIAMNASITIDDTVETTRIEHMRALLERSLEALARRRGLYFNVVAFGAVKDLADGGEMLEANADTAERAIRWVSELEADGAPDIYEMLKAMYEQNPDSASMLVGGMPSRPAGVDDATLAEYDSVGDFLIAEVRRWRRGSRTTLDITGIGLDADTRAFYRRLARAGGGTYLDG
jgi:hypothetical protein